MGIVPRICALTWMVAALYIGSAGWARMEVEEVITVSQGPQGSVNCDGVEVATMNDCLHIQREQQMSAMFPWIDRIPSLFGMLLLGFGFGCVGGIIRLFADSTMRQTEITTKRAFDLPLFGGMLGILILGVVYLVPAALVETGYEIRPTSLLFFSMIGGAFSVKVYGWVEDQVVRLFPPRADKKGDTENG